MNAYLLERYLRNAERAHKTFEQMNCKPDSNWPRFYAKSVIYQMNKSKWLHTVFHDFMKGWAKSAEKADRLIWR